jgi:hypothetical protein
MVKNIRLINPNMTRKDGYFMSFDEETDTMIQKADDGTLAFAYPLDTPVDREISSLEYDGESFWTMENKTATPSEGFRIRRWTIENFVMVLQQTFNFSSGAVDTFESDAFTIERYASTLSAGSSQYTSVLYLNSMDADIFDLISPGTRMYIGPSTHGSFTGQYESVTVASKTTGVGNQRVTIAATSGLDVGFLQGDSVVFSKNIWFLNQHYLTTADVGGLYRASILDGSVGGRLQGGAYKDIDSAAFHEVTTFPTGLTQYNKPYLVFIRTNNLLFVNVNDANWTTELSSVQNNLSNDTTEVYPVYDLGLDGGTIFRLQKKFNINGTESIEGTYNYQLATFRPFPIAIAMTADPALLPADSTTTSEVVATVTDQYALPFTEGNIQFTVSQGLLSETGWISLAGDGVVSNTYTAGDTAGLVTISAVVEIT